VVPHPAEPWAPIAPSSAPDVRRLCQHLFGTGGVLQSAVETGFCWRHLFVVEFAARSQFDLLVELSRDRGAVPDGTVCLAATGREFHGFKNRSWSALRGNLHLSMYVAPARRIENFATAFTVLAAVSVVEAIDCVRGLRNRAGIKWVNDILIEGAKVSGVLAYTQRMKEAVKGAVLGIGLNVETAPRVEPTPFVPAAASLRDFVPEAESCNQELVFGGLLRALDRNYRLLLGGGYRQLLERYRQRSLVVGRAVKICSEDSDATRRVIAAGRVTGMGDNLELFLEGLNRPISMGRLVLEDGKTAG
jgi:BirA family biotin operon repressor/biotin-[acetyl-CoA-carboxylase] ligase